MLEELGGGGAHCGGAALEALHLAPALSARRDALRVVHPLRGAEVNLEQQLGLLLAHDAAPLQRARRRLKRRNIVKDVRGSESNCEQDSREM